jgi:pimeloyl-ACP methyl ester carboxylesterase
MSSTVPKRVERALIGVIVQILAWMMMLFTPESAAGQTLVTAPSTGAASPTLVVGFVGGFVHKDDLRHSEVLMARQLQASYGNQVEVRIFENRQRGKARQWILDWLNESKNLTTSGNRKAGQIILFGHSWGASAVVYLARELQRAGVPVLLTVQVDSIKKHGEDDAIIPENVAEAANFYQPDGILHGLSRIRAADPSRTRILGNWRFQYKKEPAECRTYPWHDRFFFKGHTAIECDPHVWSLVQALIERRLAPVAPNRSTLWTNNNLPRRSDNALSTTTADERH